MQCIPISSIQILPNRQRREFRQAELQELVESIALHGLFHPPVLRQEGDSLVLVSGERRLRAMQDLHGLAREFRHDGSLVPRDAIPYVSLGELSPLAAEEAELEENVRRQDLTWQERAAATARLMDLRRRQAVDTSNPLPSTATIALEVRGSAEGIHQEATRQEIIVAAHLDDPEIRSAKSAADAFKLLRRKEATDRSRELAVSVGRTFTADVHRCLNEDSLEWLRRAPAETWDVILTDPPYGIGADEYGDSDRPTSMGSHFYSDSPENFRKIMDVFCAHSYRVTKPQAHLYLFCDVDWFLDLRLWLSNAGWRVHRTPLIWYKPAAFRAPWPEMGPQRKWEMLLYAVKGDKKVTRLYPDVIQCPPDENLGHQAQKPVALFEDLLRRSVQAGDQILDPFAGSGPIFPAAHTFKCRATGIELDSAAYGLCVNRIKLLKDSQ